MATGGPNTGATAQGYSLNNIKSNTAMSYTPNLGGTYEENRLYIRFDDASEPLELIAALERAKLIMIQQLDKLGL